MESNMPNYPITQIPRTGKCARFLIGFLVTLVFSSFSSVASETALPQFHVPGHEREMKLLGDLFTLHHSPRINCTLWDAWMHPDGERVASDNVSENITEDAMWRTYRPLGSLVFH